MVSNGKPASPQQIRVLQDVMRAVADYVFTQGPKTRGIPESMMVCRIILVVWCFWPVLRLVLIGVPLLL